MNAPLYNTEILRLAASIPFHERLAAPMASVEKRSPVCGSRVTVDVEVDGEGRVSALGMLVRACALGQFLRRAPDRVHRHQRSRSLAERATS